MTYNNNIIKNLKKEFKVSKDQDIAEIFEVSPFVFSSWKRSKSRLIEEIVKYGVKHNLNFNRIFHVDKSNVINEIPILLADQLFSYYMNPEETVSKLPLFNIPVVDKSSLGFQIISQNMEPTLNVSDIVFANQISNTFLRPKDVYVINVKDKGIFIMRLKNQNSDIYRFENDNNSYPDMDVKEKDIVRLYKINAVLSRDL